MVQVITNVQIFVASTFGYSQKKDKETVGCVTYQIITFNTYG